MRLIVFAALLCFNAFSCNQKNTDCATEHQSLFGYWENTKTTNLEGSTVDPELEVTYSTDYHLRFIDEDDYERASGIRLKYEFMCDSITLGRELLYIDAFTENELQLRYMDPMGPTIRYYKRKQE